MEVKIETARLAKLKGFDVRVRKYFDKDGNSKVGLDSTGPIEDWDYNSSFIDWCSAPTQSVLQAWLRSKDIHMYSKMFYDSKEDKMTFVCDAYQLKVGPVMKSPRLESYEEALEYALNEGLNRLDNSRRFKEKNSYGKFRR